MSIAPRAILVGFGGNLGDPVATLRQAVPLLRERVGEILQLSSLYETMALTLHGEAHPNYVNAVIHLVSDKAPAEILTELLAIERSLGRERSPDKRWEPRTIDLDILFVGDEVFESPFLTVPHPELAKRDFVLHPLVDLVPDMIHPTLQVSMQQLNETLDQRGHERFVLRSFPCPPME